MHSNTKNESIISWSCLCAILLLLLGVSTASAQTATPLGAQFVVQSDVEENGRVGAPSVAVDATDTALVTWTGADGSSIGIAARHVFADDTRGNRFVVNGETWRGQATSDAAADASGNFYVTWSTQIFDGSGLGVFGTVNPPGSGDFLVNNITQNTQDLSSVAVSSTGDHVVAFTSYHEGSHVYVSHNYGPQSIVDSASGPSANYAAVAMSADGRFMVVWERQHDVYGRIYEANGVSGNAFQINDYTTQSQVRPDVAALADGGFVVVWQGDTASGDDNISVRAFDADGTPRGVQVEVGVAGHSASEPAVSADGAGNAAVIWTYGTTQTEKGIWGQLLSPTGQAVDVPFQIGVPIIKTSTGATLPALEPQISFGSDGRFLAIWNQFQNSPGLSHIAGRRFEIVTP